MLYSGVTVANEGSFEDSLSFEEEVAANFWNTVAQKHKADVYFINARMDDMTTDHLIYNIKENKQCKNCVLILTTNGGSADAAYRMVRAIRHFYSQGTFTLFALGRCKSAGTLVALGADTIVMGHFGEFGPLNVQLHKKDSLVLRHSGLNTVECIAKLNNQLYSCFQESFFSLLRDAGVSITTQTAADIAYKLSIGLFSPMSKQIDPIEFVDIHRATEVARDYAKRLSDTKRKPLSNDCIEKLVHGYRDHGFVIDYKEAVEIFGRDVVTFLPKEYIEFEDDCYELVRDSLSPLFITTHVASFIAEGQENTAL